MSPSAIVASDLSRAAATAGALARVTGLGVSYDERLRETHGGRWEGLTAAEITASPDGEVYRAWLGGADVPAGGSETRGQLAERGTAGVLDALADVPSDGVLVATTHGGTARAVIGRLLGLPVGLWGVLGGLSNCSWSVLSEAGSGWRLTEHNAGSLPEPVLGDDR
jgi:glucosyl-3-phosphoglycerate phosphatase